MKNIFSFYNFVFHIEIESNSAGATGNIVFQCPRHTVPVINAVGTSRQVLCGLALPPLMYRNNMKLYTHEPVQKSTSQSSSSGIHRHLAFLFHAAGCWLYTIKRGHSLNAKAHRGLKICRLAGLKRHPDIRKSAYLAYLIVYS